MSDKAVTEDRSTETEKPRLKMPIATDRRRVCAFIVSVAVFGLPSNFIKFEEKKQLDHECTINFPFCGFSGARNHLG